MKKILEYRVFDLLKDPENAKFLDKVKKENPDLYVQFLNILGNKGLEIAKQKYQQYEPEYKKQQIEKEKAEKALKKKIGAKEYKTKQHQALLDLYEKEITEVQIAMIDSPLDELAIRIRKDKRISEYLESCGAKKQYTNKFKELLKNPRHLSYEFSRKINVDSLKFNKTYQDYNENREVTQSIISVNHYYNKNTKESTFEVYFKLFDNDFDSFYLPRIDAKKESEFLDQRNRYVKEKLHKSNIDKKELYDLINKFSSVLDERVYQNWKKEWDLKQTVNKFNI